MKFLKMSKDDLREIGSMSGPIFIEQLAMAGIAMLISMLVKKTGMAAVASVNLLNNLNMLFQQTYMAMGIAVTVGVAQHRGRGDLVATGKTAAQSNALSLCLSVGMAVLCLLFMGPILRLVLSDSEPLVYKYSAIYLSYNIYSLPFMSMYYITTAAIRGSGHPSQSLVATLIYNGSYAAMAVVSVTVFDAGLVGVSISMLISRVLAAGAGLFYLRRGNENMRVKNPFQFKLEKSILTPVIIMSIPIFIENLVFQAGKMITQTFAVPFGTNDLAVNGIVNSIHMLMIVTGMTASAAVTPVVGRYIGMRKYDEARAKLKQFQILCTGFAVFSAALIYFLIPPLARFYSPVASVQKQIIFVAGTGCLMYPLFWPASFVTPAGLRGAGDMRFTTYVALASMLAVRICLGYFTAVVLRLSVIGIWIGMYADWLVRGAFYLWRQRGDKWLKKSLI